MKKFKGFYVPNKGASEIINTPENTQQKFCLKSRMEDCCNIKDAEGKGQDCPQCLFFWFSTGDQELAFKGWHAAKGKVQYDRD